MSWITWYVVAEDLELEDGAILYAGRRLSRPTHSEAEARTRLRELILEHPAAALWSFDQQIRGH
jgi:hypothetical protein